MTVIVCAIVNSPPANTRPHLQLSNQGQANNVTGKHVRGPILSIKDGERNLRENEV